MSAGQLSVPFAVLVASGLLDLKTAQRVIGRLEAQMIPPSFAEMVAQIREALADGAS